MVERKGHRGVITVEREGHRGAYTLTGIDEAMWRQVKAAAALKGMTIREWVLYTLRGAVMKKGGTK